MPRLLAFVPARAGSSRVKLKNIRPLAQHPLMAYTIQAALQSGVFERVVVSTDSEQIADIARHYGAEVPFLRPPELASSTSPDIEWLTHAFNELGRDYDAFSILRPTSPFRLPQTIQRAHQEFLGHSGIDSIRAVEKCHEHPGKMWTVQPNGLLEPLLPQDHLEVPYHARQYQDCPEVYIQNSSLEMAWSRVIWETCSREGKVIAPFFTDGKEGFAIDYEEDWMLAEHWTQTGDAQLPEVNPAPYPLAD
jgi:N-acylneuraminate cytidylyltransferase